MLKNILALLLSLSSTLVFAQDANYWSAAYGPGGFMMPGAVIAKNGDSGVLFFNPALLAYNTKNAATISGNIYNYQSTKIKNGAGTGLDLTASSTGIIPVIASNTIYLKLKSPITIAYALMNNPVMRYQVSQRKDDEMNVLDDSYSPGKEVFVGQYVSGNSVDETTAMLAVGKPVSSKLAVGISFAAHIRKQTFVHDTRSKTLINDNSSLFQKLVTTSEYYLVNNFHVGLAIKAGVNYDLAERHHVGFLFSLPLIHISGKGDLLTDYSINNLKLGTTDVFLLASSKQTKLATKWKTPISAAAGYTYDYGAGKVYIAAEYFGKVDEYNVVQPRNEGFIRPDTGDNRNYTAGLLRLKSANKPIVNFALAASFPIKERFTGYCSLRTDFNYLTNGVYDNSEGFRAATSVWNLYHMQLGTNFKKRKFNLRAGLLLSYGTSNRYMQEVNFDSPSERNLLLGEKKAMTATRFSSGLMFAYIHNF